MGNVSLCFAGTLSLSSDVTNLNFIEWGIKTNQEQIKNYAREIAVILEKNNKKLSNSTGMCIMVYSEQPVIKRDKEYRNIHEINFVKAVNITFAEYNFKKNTGKLAFLTYMTSREINMEIMRYLIDVNLDGKLDEVKYVFINKKTGSKCEIKITNELYAQQQFYNYNVCQALIALTQKTK